MKPKTKKQVETEKWVDEYIKKFNYPPTYVMIEKHFKIDASAAHFRCRNFRDKMRKNNVRPNNLNKMSIVELRIAFEKRFIAKTMTAEQMQGAESVWQWIVEVCGGF